MVIVTWLLLVLIVIACYMSTMSYMTIWCIECIHWCSSEFIRVQWSEWSDLSNLFLVWMPLNWTTNNRTGQDLLDMETLDKDTEIPREWPSAPVPCAGWQVDMDLAHAGILVHELYGIKDDQGLGFSWMFFEDLWGICHYYLFRRAKWKSALRSYITHSYHL